MYVHTIEPKTAETTVTKLATWIALIIIMNPGNLFNIRSEVMVTESQSAETCFRR